MAVSIHPHWENILQDTFESPYFQALINFVKSAYGSKRCYPPGKLIFNAFDLCPPDKTKVVILGQDPYHGPNQAHGLAFSVKRNVTIPPSLNNIFREISEDLKSNKRSSGDLTNWAKQGVLLLNTCLTVFPGKPGSHAKLGWQKFTDAVIEAVDTKDNIVFLLWGSYAQKKKDLLLNKSNLVLEAPHPSPLSAHRGFFGCKHFSKANMFLKNNNIQEIDWIS